MRKTEGVKGERDVWDQGGEAFSTWDCPRWTQAAPSLYKQPPLLSSPIMPVIHNSAPTLHRFWDPHQKI